MSFGLRHLSFFLVTKISLEIAGGHFKSSLLILIGSSREHSLLSLNFLNKFRTKLVWSNQGEWCQHLHRFDGSYLPPVSSAASQRQQSTCHGMTAFHLFMNSKEVFLCIIEVPPSRNWLRTVCNLLMFCLISLVVIVAFVFVDDVLGPLNRHHSDPSSLVPFWSPIWTLKERPSDRLTTKTFVIYSIRRCDRQSSPSPIFRLTMDVTATESPDFTSSVVLASQYEVFFGASLYAKLDSV